MDLITETADYSPQPAIALGKRLRLGGETRDPVPYLVSAALVALAVVLSALLVRVVPQRSLPLVFLLAILFSARWYGLWPSMAAVVLSGITYNFYFVPPIYSFAIGDRGDVLALALFIIVAAVVGNLTALTQRQADRIRQHARITDELYALSRKIAGINTLDALLPVVTYRIAGLLQAKLVLLLPERETLVPKCAYPPEGELAAEDLDAARSAWKTGLPAGRGAAGVVEACRWYCQPLQTRRRFVGVLAAERLDGEAPSAEDLRLLAAIADQVAVAVERLVLTHDVDRVRVDAEGERLRNALLTSISHDLRTPLAGIIGALGSLKRFGAHYDAAVSQELVSVALEDSQRLDRFVGNLLDMTRLEAGGVAMRPEPTDLSETLREAIRHSGAVLAAHRIEASIDADLPFVRAEASLLERVVFNLLDNAAKYSPAGSTIEILARPEGDTVVLAIADQGPGIAPAMLEAIFEKFTRLDPGDRQRAGTGLGLAIARGFLDAMGASIAAANRSDRSGAVFTVRLPSAGSADRAQPEMLHGC